ncbi:TetR/AcrR family transcriptional regulator [Rhodococcus kronopolitis]|uniref:TetR/AcrR family transcriptional regulator n=1 Tax=Rhodococcus kronopolitis TaxID=1460226 RepID=A0ABV9FVZ0_9NOCA
MARPPDHHKRAALLAGVVTYIGENGLADLSLRPLAAALGTTSRMLIHYFGTKEELLVQALATQRPDFDAFFADVSDAAGLEARLRESWTAMTVGDDAVSTRILLQVIAIGPTQPGPFADFAEKALDTVIGALAAAMVRSGWSRGIATADATMISAGFRGLLSDRLITGDFERTELSAERLIGVVLGGMR